MILCLSYANIVFAIDRITPIPNSISYDKEKAELGKSLYMDKSLSKDGKVSVIPAIGLINTVLMDLNFQ
ncbi:Uncharacterised protein [Campylobacter jejuni]|uniref:Cytochrome c peroxidase n=1 Tax=Campylobacter jejuni subsp. doylei TaxID=32021 RepID=A0A381CYX3_CAMJU|nr:cytochrome c peroxidase [Campylobacter jejuni subsp. doylei]VTX55912.1 Uncharacterised protein [Campylobacter jejuni]SUW97888.1 cytochrome c peroxidase [Campylobacter jejuni subsp. doylei]SUW98791.1 cytochrome c peroxidase [Campylobacter jejuni subsp. doylei]VEG62521.1 cytochrome c peroxidase [Campylobacter jejuni subsp. doylei]